MLIVVLVVVTRRRSGEDRAYSNTADRNVVAFENPMYDQNETGPMVGASDGLYDTPAFQADSDGKDNPAYQSNENLADDDGDSGGYLDVAAASDSEECNVATASVSRWVAVMPRSLMA